MFMQLHVRYVGTRLWEAPRTVQYYETEGEYRDKQADLQRFAKTLSALVFSFLQSIGEQVLCATKRSLSSSRAKGQRCRQFSAGTNRDVGARSPNNR